MFEKLSQLVLVFMIVLAVALSSTLQARPYSLRCPLRPIGRNLARQDSNPNFLFHKTGRSSKLAQTFEYECRPHSH